MDAPEELLRSARAISEAGSRIAAAATATRRADLKGALLERIVHVLVSQRRRSLLREVAVAIAPAGHHGQPWTNPKELVVDDDPFEVFECKVSAVWIDQGDIDELCDIADAADTEGVESRPTIAVLETQRAVRAQRLNIWRPIYFAHIDDMVDLRLGPAGAVLA